MLVVCRGNICRSPYAGAVLAEALGAENVRDRGLHVTRPAIAAKKVRIFAAETGIDLGQHRATMLEQDDVDWATLILYMDASNLRDLQLHYAFDGQIVLCLGQYVDRKSIPDPNYLSGDGLRLALEVLRAASEAAAEVLKRKTPVG